MAKKTYSSTLVIVVIAIIFVIILLRLTGLINPVRSFTSRLMSPVYDATYSVGNSISSFFSRPKDVNELQAENEKLRQENLELTQNLSLLQEAEQENLSLRQLLDFFEDESNDHPRVIARVIGKDPENPSVLILNAGSRDGVQVNNAFVIEEGVLVAKIIEADTKTSKALLISDSQSQVAVTISGGAPTNKLAKGDRGLSIILDQIPQSERIGEGEIVITSGLETTIPRGLIIGEIEEIISEQNDLFQKAILRPLVDFQTIYLGAVILS